MGGGGGGGGKGWGVGSRRNILLLLHKIYILGTIRST